MRESVVEKHFRLEVIRIGGRVRKYVSPGRIGVQDRMAFYPNGVIHFVELKAPRKDLRTRQKYEAKWMKDWGFDVFKLDSIEAVDDYIRNIT